MHELYNIYVEGVIIREGIDEDEMLDVTQDLADEFYSCGYPHPDIVEVKYLGHEDDY
tara:strand:+ start:624 stop:794 length:171 start_codon:yes stop_codon:yes gene_type:complete